MFECSLCERFHSAYTHTHPIQGKRESALLISWARESAHDEIILHLHIWRKCTHEKAWSCFETVNFIFFFPSFITIWLIPFQPMCFYKDRKLPVENDTLNTSSSNCWLYIPFVCLPPTVFHKNTWVIFSGALSSETSTLIQYSLFMLAHRL